MGGKNKYIGHYHVEQYMEKNLKVIQMLLIVTAAQLFLNMRDF